MTTQKPIKLYAIEFESRDFSLTQFDLDNGFRYSGVRLFDSQNQAQADIESDVKQAMIEREDLDPEEDEDDYKTDDEIRDEMGSVAPLIIHPDGQVLDMDGNDMAGFIGRSEDQSKSEVAEHIRQLYAQVSEQLRKKRDLDASEPGM